MGHPALQQRQTCFRNEQGFTVSQYPDHQTGFRIVLSIAAWFANLAIVAGAQPQMTLSTFVAEVTPPVGHPLQGGVGIRPVATVTDPLYAHGVVLHGAGEPIVICSVDWCGIGNDAHDRWRVVLAEAACTSRERVLVCAIHQHDSPMADLEAERLVGLQQTGRTSLDLKFHEDAVQGRC